MFDFWGGCYVLQPYFIILALFPVGKDSILLWSLILFAVSLQAFRGPFCFNIKSLITLSSIIYSTLHSSRTSSAQSFNLPLLCTASTLMQSIQFVRGGSSLSLHCCLFHLLAHQNSAANIYTACCMFWLLVVKILTVSYGHVKVSCKVKTEYCPSPLEIFVRSEWAHSTQ